MKKVKKAAVYLLTAILFFASFTVLAFGAAAEQDAGGATGKLIYFWPFEGTTKDISHHEFEIDTEETGDFIDGVVGKGYYTDLPLLSEELPEDIDLSEFTVAFWVKWEENSHGSYTVPFAIAEKATNYHFEIYYTVDGDEGELAFYETAGGMNVEHIVKVERDTYNHVVAVNGGKQFRLYFNGELVYTAQRSIRMKGLGSGGDVISLCGLNDRTLNCSGEYDEVLLAGYMLSDELIGKLYSDPAAAHEEIVKLVEANYPEGYTRPTEKPTQAPTEKPAVTPDNTATDAPASAPTGAPEPTSVPTEPEDVKTPVPGKTAGSGSENTEPSGGGSNIGVILAIVAGVIIVGAAVAAALLLKKKK